MNYEERYKLAERMSQLVASRDVLNTQVIPHWIIGTDTFWYERDTETGVSYRLVDAAAGTNEAAFDHVELAGALAKAAEKEQDEVDPNNLPITNLAIESSPLRVFFNAFGRSWKFEGATGVCAEHTVGTNRVDWALSPDGQQAAYVKDYNIWIFDLASGSERPLTSDGERLLSYGTSPISGQHRADQPAPPAPPTLAWSPDGRTIFTLCMDERLVAEVPVMELAPIDGTQMPKVHFGRWSAPGDRHVSQAHFVAINVETARLTPAHYPAVPTGRMNDGFFKLGLAWFGADSRHAYFVDVARGDKSARVVEFDTRTGATRTVCTEETNTYLELGPLVYGRTNVHYLPARHQLIWQSERSGHAHLYLYDLASGEELGAITSGCWRVRDIIAIDHDGETVFFTASGFDDARDPYYRRLYRVDFDGGNLTLLTTEDVDHDIMSQNDFSLLTLAMLGVKTDDIAGVSPSGEFIIDSMGTIDQPARSVLRGRDGQIIMELETADYSAIEDVWQWPEPFCSVADDGVTRIYGVIIKPSDFDPQKSYPVIDLIYGGPQVSNVPKSSPRGLMETATLSEALALAQIGCIVVVIDGRGTALRDRAFHEASYGAIQDASNINDHIAAIREIAQSRSYIDLGRVGITGFSGGGYATAGAMLRESEFYKVGVASSGNYDQRFFVHGWGERYHGLVEGDNYASQSLVPHAENLKGKLLFTHGMLDIGVHVAALFQLTQALIDANKDFDLLLEPRLGHERSGYMTRRVWDYFVRHLIGDEPPETDKVISGMDLLIARAMAAMQG